MRTLIVQTELSLHVSAAAWRDARRPPVRGKRSLWLAETRRTSAPAGNLTLSLIWVEDLSSESSPQAPSWNATFSEGLVPRGSSICEACSMARLSSIAVRSSLGNMVDPERGPRGWAEGRRCFSSQVKVTADVRSRKMRGATAATNSHQHIVLVLPLQPRRSVLSTQYSALSAQRPALSHNSDCARVKWYDFRMSSLKP
jgi:hypothetical protein